MSIKKYVLLFLLFTSLLQVSSAQTFTVDTVLNNGSKNNRINLVFMGDGYTAAQQARFTSDVNAMVAAIFAQTPFNYYKSFFNVYTIHVISKDSGAGHPHLAADCPPLSTQPAATVNNYFGSTFDYQSIHRFLMATNSTAITNVLQANLPEFDIAAIIVNTPYYGGAAEGTTAVCSRDVSTSEILLHELGHSFAGLGDEYSYSGCGGIEEWNATQDIGVTTCRWKAWFNGGVKNTDCTNVGTYVGANYCPTAWYRPECNCKMRNLGQPYCRICMERFVYAYNYYVNLIDTYLPTAASKTLTNGQTQNYSATFVSPVPNSQKVTWKLDNVVVASNVSSYLVNANLLSAGTHTLVLTVVDSTYHSRTTMPSYSRTWTIVKSGSATTSLNPFNPVCANTAAFTLTGGSPAGGTYSGTGVSGNVFTPSVAGVGTFTITYTANSITATQPLTVNALPTVLASPSSVTICGGNTTTLTASGATTYTWSPSIGLNTLTGASVIASPATNQAYTATGFSNGCSNTGSVLVFVGTGPNVTVSSNNSICSGDSTILTAGGADTYTWSPSTGLNSTTDAVVTAKPAITTTYSVTGTTNGCSKTQTVVVTVNAIPVISVSGNTSLCAGSNTTLTASGAASYTWSPVTDLNFSTGAVVTASPANDVVYTVTGTNNGCSQTQSVALTVGGVSNLSVSSDTTICSGSNATLTAGGETTFTWLPATGLNTTSGPSVTASPVSSTTYTVTGSSGNCLSSKTITIIVNATPTLTLSGSASVCTGNNTTLTASGAATYSWVPSTALNTTAGNSVIANPSAAITYTVTGTTNGCSQTKTVSVAVNAMPTVMVSANTAVCAGSNTLLSSGGATSYAWLPATGLSSTNIANVSASPLSTTTYTVTGTTGGCSSSKTVTVTVNAIPALTVSTGTSVCAGNNTTLTVSGASTYAWSPAATLNASTGTSVIATPASSITYTITGSANGCNASKTIGVTVNAAPTVTVTANTAICAGSNTSLIASGATTYAWSPSNGLNNVTAASVTATPASTTTYTIKGTTGGCSSSKTVTVTVNALPVLTVSAGTSVCAGKTATLTASGATTYSWTPASTLNTTTDASVTATPASSTTYSVIGKANGCSASKTIAVAVNANPTVTVSANASICTGNSATLTAGGATTYSWLPSTALSATSGTSVTATPSSAITYTVTGLTNGCSQTKTVSVAVNTVPTVTVSANTAICAGSNAPLSASGATTYTWSPATGLNNSTGAAVTASPTSTITYTVTGSNGTCSAAKTVMVTVNASPALTVSSGTSVCSGSNATLTASGASTYSWTPALTLSTSTGTSVTANPTTSITYSVTGTANGCPATKTIAVAVNANPVMSVTSNTAVCAGSSATLVASGAATYTWTPATGLNNATAASVTATPASSITYTIKGTTGGCSSTKTVAVVVNALPVITVSAGTAVCSGKTATLTASGASTYAWTPATTLNTATGTSVTATPASSITYSVTGTANGCSAVKTIAVAVTANPVVTLSANASVCNGNSATLTAGGATTYTWLPSTALSTTSGIAVVATPSSTITYTVTGLSNGCSQTKTVSVTVNAVPTVSVSANATICAGSNTSLSASGATTYSWVPSTGLNNATNALVTATPASTITYTVTGTNGGCSATKTVAVTVNALPALTVSNAASVCAGSTAALTAGGASAYSWTPALTLSTSTGTSVTATPAASVTYSVTGTANGCSVTKTIAVSVNTIPTVTVSANAALCAGSNTTLTAGGATTYAWAPGSPLNTNSGSSVVASPLTTTTFTLTGTSNGCSASKTVQVTVNALPTVTASANTTICNGNNTSLTASGATSYSWLPATALNLSTGGVVIATPSSTITYTVTGTANGCSKSQTVAVTVNALPNVSVSPNTAVCSGGTANLTASGATTYSWSPASALNVTNSSAVNASPTTAITYTVTGTSNGCSASKTVSVAIDAPLNITVTPSANNVCTGSSSTLTAGGAAVYTWLPATALTATSGTSVIANPTASITYTVTGTSAGCTGTKTVVVGVTPLPVITASSNTTICSGSNTSLTAGGATTYTWLPVSGLNQNTGNAVVANPTSTITYTVTGTANGCSKSQSVVVSVNALPNLSVTANTTVCPGSSANLTASGATSYTWMPASALNVTNSSSVTATPGAAITYTVTGTANGCSSSKTVTVGVNAPVNVAVTPTTTNVCAGGSSTIAATGATLYTWLPATGLNVATGTSVIAKPVASITYTVTGTSNGCTGTKTVAIGVTALPVLTASSNTTICSGSNASLTAGGATTYTWLPATGLSRNTGNAVVANPTSTITYTVTGTANGCSKSQPVVVLVNALPSLSVSANTSVCKGGTANLTASGATSYTWLPASALNVTNNSTVAASPTTAITYTVTGTSNGCSASKTVSIGISPDLNIGAIASTSKLCTGSNATLTATGASTYSWSPSTGLNNATGTSVTAHPTSSVTYTVTGSSGGCTGTQTVIVNVIPLPVITASNATVCAGSTTPLTAGGATLYTWLPSTGLSSTTGSVVNAAPASSLTYTITGTANGCSASKTVTVGINPLPVISATANAALCKGSSDTLNVDGAAAYSWLPYAVLSDSAGSSVIATPSITTTFTVTGITNGCTSNKEIIVRVDTVPNLNVSSNNSICYGSSTVLTVAGAATYTWYPSSSLNKSTSDQVIANPNQSTTYTVQGVAGACSAVQTVQVDVNMPPSITGTTKGASSQVIKDGAIALSVSGGIPASFSWSNGDSTKDLSHIRPGVYTVTVTATTTCQSVRSFEVPLLVPSQCPGVSSVYTSDIHSNYALIHWTPNLSSYGYSLRQREVGKFKWSLAYASGSDSTLKLPDLMPGTSYEFQVLSYCNTGHTDSSSYSMVQRFTTLVNCICSGNFSTLYIKANSATLHWDTVLNADSYRVRVRIAGPNPWKNYFTYQGANSLNVDNLLPNTTYEWQVRSNCNNGNDFSNYSDVQTFTTLTQHGTGVENVSSREAQLTVYPNPSHGKFVIETSLDNQVSVNVTITDIYGKEILNENRKADQGKFNAAVDISALPAGTYFVSIKKGKETINRKITKQ